MKKTFAFREKNVCVEICIYLFLRNWKTAFFLGRDLFVLSRAQDVGERMRFQKTIHTRHRT